MKTMRLVSPVSARRGLLLVALIAVIGLAPPCRALADNEPGPEEEAQAAFDRAEKLAADHKYPDALKELEGAAALDPTAPILLNLGRLREETGDSEGAKRAYRELILRHRRSRLSAEAKTHLQTLESQPAKEPPVVKPVAPPRPVVAAVPLLPTPCPTCPTCPPPPVPVQKHWWFWVATVGGAVVLSGAAVGLTLALDKH